MLVLFCFTKPRRKRACSCTRLTPTGSEQQPERHKNFGQGFLVYQNIQIPIIKSLLRLPDSFILCHSLFLETILPNLLRIFITMATTRTLLRSLQTLERSQSFRLTFLRAQSSWVTPSKRSRQYGSVPNRRPVINGKAVAFHVNEFVVHAKLNGSMSGSGITSRFTSYVTIVSIYDNVAN